MQVLTIDYQQTNARDLFNQSLKETGFAVIKNHLISNDLIRHFYDCWQTFFTNPDKINYTYKKPEQNGYFPFRTEKAKDHHVSDLKEFYHFYAWAKQPDHISTVSLQLYQELVRLAAQLLQWIESGLPAHIASNLSMPLSSMITESKNTLLRILHYPPLTNDIEQDAVRAAPHEDINLITLLPAATAPGLEVQDAQGNWHAVDCDMGHIVVNVGDMLQECTERFFQSTTHRVVNPSDNENASRYSAPLFLHPRGEVKLSTQYTADEYLTERLRQIGIY